MDCLIGDDPLPKRQSIGEYFGEILGKALGSTLVRYSERHEEVAGEGFPSGLRSTLVTHSDVSTWYRSGKFLSRRYSRIDSSKV